MLEDAWSHSPAVSDDLDGATLLHSILTDGPSAGAVYRRGSDRTAPQRPEEAVRPTSPADLENGVDFGYSQKFFHIADGNLYSVFSPLQGRSYGGKPSFLRKQQCVVRESQGRGRKNPKRGLKFHNFLPSESVTSEKEDKSLSGEGEIWKVHAECRLREEHGTKQIVVSNWSVSEENPVEEPDDDLSRSSVGPPSFDRSHGCPGAVKGTELGAIVDRLGLVPRVAEAPRSSRPCPPTNSPKSRPGEPSKKSLARPATLRFSRRKRRKPLQTRKVVPYHQYLSMLEEDEASPLDLSRRSPSSSPTQIVGRPAGPQTSEGDLPFTPTVSVSFQQKEENDRDVFSVLSVGAGSSFLPVGACSRTSTGTTLGSTERTPVRSQPPPSRFRDTGVQESGEGEETRKAPRTRARSNQRTIIRKKLEDTFRQNGFLVKTKQVSDGEATFCKFRQLKKYTRYYLKSWQDHLPEEVHKLWKGFLPPKTAIPSASHGKREECKPIGE